LKDKKVKKKLLNSINQGFSYYPIRNTCTFTSFLKEKKGKKKEVTKQYKARFFLLFLMMEGSVAGCVLLTTGTGSGCGYGSPNTRIRIPNTATKDSALSRLPTM
jgi:hypothetical protein